MNRKLLPMKRSPRPNCSCTLPESAAIVFTRANELLGEPRCKTSTTPLFASDDDLVERGNEIASRLPSSFTETLSAKSVAELSMSLRITCESDHADEPRAARTYTNAAPDGAPVVTRADGAPTTMTVSVAEMARPNAGLADDAPPHTLASTPGAAASRAG
jgi:hypothetical protein